MLCLTLLNINVFATCSDAITKLYKIVIHLIDEVLIH